jgi:hypothetical protein
MKPFPNIHEKGQANLKTVVMELFFDEGNLW